MHSWSRALQPSESPFAGAGRRRGSETRAVLTGGYLGGIRGVGPVEVEPDEPVFHSEWEGMIFGMAEPTDGEGPVSVDEFRYSVERFLLCLHQRGLLRTLAGGLERLLVQDGVVTEDEIDARMRELSLQPDDYAPSGGQEFADLLSVPYTRDVSAPRGRAPRRFAVGDRVVARGRAGWAHSAAGLCPRPHRHRRPLPRRVRFTPMLAGPGRIHNGATASASSLTRSGATRPRHVLPCSSTPSRVSRARRLGRSDGPRARSRRLRGAPLKALVALVEKGLLASDAIDRIVAAYEEDIGPLNRARVVARAWVDPAFRLLEDATPAIRELDIGGLEAEHMVALENTGACTTSSCARCARVTPGPCSAYPHRIGRRLIVPASLSSPGAAGRDRPRPGRLCRGAGMGLERGYRYLVLPERPDRTEDLTDDELAGLSPATHDRRREGEGPRLMRRDVAEMQGLLSCPAERELVFGEPWESRSSACDHRLGGRRLRSGASSSEADRGDRFLGGRARCDHAKGATGATTGAGSPPSSGC